MKIKTMTFAAFAALAAAAPLSASAAQSQLNDVGLGVVLGEPIGGTAKLWFDDKRAVDLGAGISDGQFGFWGDFLWHDWTLLPQPSQGKLGGYVGAGAQVRAGDQARFGIRTVVGVSYRTTGHPLELFAEAGPLWRLTQGGNVDAVGGVGLRVFVGK